jgi:hypothetical protein
VLSSESAETQRATDCLFPYVQHNDEPEKAILPTGSIQLQKAGRSKEKIRQLFFSMLQNYLINLV